MRSPQIVDKGRISLLYRAGRDVRRETRATANRTVFGYGMSNTYHLSILQVQTARDVSAKGTDDTAEGPIPGPNAPWSAKRADCAPMRSAQAFSLTR